VERKGRACLVLTAELHMRPRTEAASSIWHSFLASDVMNLKEEAWEPQSG
jgi:hypothetical protein